MQIAYQEKLNEAKAHFAKELKMVAEKLRFLRQSNQPIRILCPGAGLLPSLSILLEELQGNSPAETSDITVVCVDRLEDKAIAQNCYGFLPRDKLARANFKSLQLKIYQSFSHKPEEKQARVAQKGAYLSIEYHLQKDIYEFIKKYKGPKFQIIFYENPLVAPPMLLADSIFKEGVGAITTRKSIPSLAHVVAENAIIIGVTETKLEMSAYSDLLRYSFPKTQLWVNSPPLKHNLMPFYTMGSYQNVMVAQIETKGQQKSLEQKHIDRVTADVERSDRLYTPFLLASGVMSFFSPSFKLMNLVTFSAEKSEWLSVLSLIFTVYQMSNHQVGPAGNRKHLIVALLQLSLLLLMNNFVEKEQVDRPSFRL